MPHQYKLARAAELTVLGAMRDFIDDACRTENVSEDIAFKLKLAVDEAATNVIEHGYAGMDPGSIILTLKFEPQRVLVELTDFGHPFEPSEPSTPDAVAVLEDRPTAGFGLYFIYQTMDQVDYRSSVRGNTLIFVKNL
jgi:anti-sigma regulatory factor (Ser/Thr protein kinase)